MGRLPGHVIPPRWWSLIGRSAVGGLDEFNERRNATQRPAAPVLLIDAEDRLLLLRANIRDVEVWITPGAALEPGETAEQAALRELREETGVETANLSSCVW